MKNLLYLFIAAIVVSSCIVYQKGEDGKPGTPGKNADEIVTTQKKNKKLAEKPKEDNPSVTEPPASTPPPPESAQDWQGPVTDLF